MIKEMLSSEAVGQYAAAVRLSEAWYFIPSVISASLFPAIINVKKSNKVYKERLQKLYSMMVWIGLLIALPMTFLADYLVDTLFGLAYHLAGDVLVLHIWTVIFVGLGVASSKWFIVENLQSYSFYRTLAGGILNILLNLILIPKWGIYGAALATLFSQIMATYFFDLFNLKTREMFYMKSKALVPIL